MRWLLPLLAIAQTSVAVTADERLPQRLVTRWAEDVSKEAPWPEYPRPQMTRPDWLSLNGHWGLSIQDRESGRPIEFPESILVPFPLESELGGVRKKLLPQQTAWYRKKVSLPEGWRSRRVLLHFGAVDWHAEVWVNGHCVGQHRGGYDPFSFDITGALRPEGENELLVAVSDPTDQGLQPIGKQKIVPEGIWYTPVSGIWQTVWLEPVAETSVRRVNVTPDFAKSAIEVTAEVSGEAAGLAVEVVVRDGQRVVASGHGAPNAPLRIETPGAKAWSPSSPYLYDLDVKLLRGNDELDRVVSYFGMRSITLGPDQNGQTRMLLNGKPLFQFGPLDQGYWPDGLYTPPTEEAMRWDLEFSKRLGFNMVRKHVKVESARWYYWCDRLGLLVWQDMPNGDAHAPWPQDTVEIHRTAGSARQYRHELQAIVDACRHFPCVVVWAPFNEAWGQFDTAGTAAWLKAYDPTRLVVAASGGNDLGVGDLKDDHFYPGPGCPPAERARAAVLGEYGGFGLPVSGHTWQDEANWGYRSFTDPETLLGAYREAVNKLRPMVESHLSAAVYTQITDVEIEVNGLATYDREVIKIDEEAVRTLNESLYGPIPEATPAERLAAATIAWWRFEGGEPGERLPDLSRRLGGVAARDLSGHNNHLYAFSEQSAPRVSGVVPSMRSSVATNAASLDLTEPPGLGAPLRDLFTDPHLSRTHMDVLDRYAFQEWTIEASFSIDFLDGEQCLLAKEGTPSTGGVAPLSLSIAGEANTLRLEVTDGSGERKVLDSRLTPKPGAWLHVLAACDGATVTLYLANDGPAMNWREVASAKTSGALLKSAGTWVIGRGYAKGAMGLPFRGKIDEVRITTKSLPPTSEVRSVGRG